MDNVEMIETALKLEPGLYVIESETPLPVSALEKIREYLEYYGTKYDVEFIILDSGLKIVKKKNED